MKTSLKATLLVTIAITVIALAAVLSAGWTPKLGLDLAGGFQATLKPDHKITSGELTTVNNIIQQRIDGLGISGATSNSQGGNVVVQVPGLSNRQQLLSIIEQTAEMQFRPVLCLAPPVTSSKTKSPGPLPTACPTANQQTAANLNVSTSTGEAQASPPAWTELAKYQTTSAANDDATKTVLLSTAANSGYNGERMLLGPAQVVGKQIASASAVFNSPDWVVDLNFNGSGSTAWDNLARAQFHALIAIDLDGQVISAPLTQPSQAGFTSFAGKVQISGNFTEASAKSLSLDLQYGALPVGLSLLYNQVVSPTLGRSSLNAGLAAGIGGLLLVLIYTIFYYRALGIVVVTGLAVTAALLWAIVSAFSHSSDLTLDLSGIAGLIVSVGITVDSYIVYFERLKDEARAGRSVRSTVDRAFQGAFRTVLAADSVSFLAALILYIFSVSTVRGFAFFLGLATLLDVFTTFFFTRPLVIWLGRSKKVTDARIIGIARGLAVPTEPA
ncbi:MAG: protein translocase subunit SecD [Acidimicrobiales bacterium]